MKKILLILLAFTSFASFAQAEFPEGVQITGGQPTNTTPAFITTTTVNGLQEKIPSAYIEKTANKISTITGYSETLYPNEKASHDALDAKLNISDLPSNLTLYATTALSGISTYTKWVSTLNDPDYNTVAVNVSTGAISGTNQLISGLTSIGGQIIGNPGLLNVTTVGNIRRTAGTGTAKFYFELYKRTAAGVESFLGVSNFTLPVDFNTYAEFSATAVWNDGVFTETDRIVIKFYGARIAGGSDPTFDFEFGGLTPVRTIVPVPFRVVAGEYEVKINKVSTLTASDVLYPNNNAVITGLATKVSLTGNETITGTKSFDNILLRENPINTNSYRLGQPMAGTDLWRIYGSNSSDDRGELVFEVGDNGVPFSANGQRFKFSYDASSGGVAKNPFIIDYNEITADANITATSFVKSGGLASEFLKANGGVDNTVYQPLLTNPVTGTGDVNFIPKFTGVNTLGNSGIIDNIALITANNNFSANGIISSLSAGGEVRSYQTSDLYTSIKTTFPKSGLFRSNSSFFVYYDTSNGSTNLASTVLSQPIKFLNPNVEVGRFAPTSGAFLIGTTADNGIDKVQVNGTISASPATLSNQVVVKSQLDLKADILSPTFTGVPNVPTATFGTNTTQIASTAFVLANSSPVIPYLEYENAFKSIWNNGLSTGNNNTVYGKRALPLSSSTNNNNAFGFYALGGNTLGSNNVAFGNNAGYAYTGGFDASNNNNSIFIGNNTYALGANQTNQIVIGDNSTGNGSNTATLGNDSILGTYLKGKVIANNVIRLKNYTVSTLPAGTQGDSAYVTDALAPTYMTAVVGGGTVITPVFFNGTNWVSH